jgi:hypothetical protein
MGQSTDTEIIVKNIIKSSTFQNKEVMKGLLLCLYNAYKQNKKLKEIDIAIEYFKRDKNFIPGDDTIVRVNIYKLRNLLTKYYTSEGISENTRVSIPKGAYSLTFGHSDKFREKTSKKILKLFLIFTLCGSGVINIILIVTKSDKYKIDNHPIWQQYNNASKPVSIILGNPFFYKKNDSVNNPLIYRNLNINIYEDLEKSPPDIDKLPYTYFSANNVMPLPWIFAALKSSNSIELQALTDVNPEHIKNNNQIFIANINSFGFYQAFLEETSIRIKSNPREILLIRESDTTHFSVPEEHNEYFDDYAFLIKIRGANNNIITMMGDFHASGNTGIARMLKDDKKMKELNDYALKHYDMFPRYFEMIVKVSSYRQADLKTSIIYFNEIKYEGLNAMLFPEMMN